MNGLRHLLVRIHKQKSAHGAQSKLRGAHQRAIAGGSSARRELLVAVQQDPGIIEMVRLRLLDWSDLIDMSDRDNPGLSKARVSTRDPKLFAFTSLCWCYGPKAKYFFPEASGAEDTIVVVIEAIHDYTDVFAPAYAPEDPKTSNLVNAFSVDCATEEWHTHPAASRPPGVYNPPSATGQPPEFYPSNDSSLKTYSSAEGYR